MDDGGSCTPTLIHTPKSLAEAHSSDTKAALSRDRVRLGTDAGGAIKSAASGRNTALAPAIAARRTSCCAIARFSRITPPLVICATATKMVGFGVEGDVLRHHVTWNQDGLIRAGYMRYALFVAHVTTKNMNRLVYAQTAAHAVPTKETSGCLDWT